MAASLHFLHGRYCGPPPEPHGLWGAWNGDPALLALFVCAIAITVRLPSERRAMWLGAIFALALAFLSPLCALSSALFSARAVHHLLIVGAAAPLLALAVGRAPRIGPAASLALFTAVLWLWHVPLFYDAALANKALYWLMQASLLGASWLFWSAVIGGRPGADVMALVGATIQMGFLGALLSFAPDPLYASHLATTVPFGLGPLEDQQLAGLLMWVPGMLPFAFWAAWLGARRWRHLAAASA
ncbi:cytochrome c oxidase assembly protein [Pelagerythrobacter sp.]|uniref:cytochrome c oxidase assembly protein n=1 Tax=Pelagerythrobacter sp. TaxID=2800702 RepID=UPI0035AFD1CE